MTVPEILRAAATRVRAGWTQKAGNDGKGNVCAHEALRLIVFEQNTSASWKGCEYSRQWFGVIEALKSALPIFVISDWNDAKGQTAENVAAGLEYAALHWEEEQAQQTEQPELVTT